MIRWSVAVALVFCGGCAPIAIDQPAPFANFSAKARQIFQRMDRPVDSNSPPVAETTATLERGSAKAVPVRTHRIAPTIPAAQPVVSPSPARVSFQDHQPSNEQANFNATQAGFQAPLGRTYSNPAHPSPQDFSVLLRSAYPNGVPQNMNFQQGPFNQAYRPQGYPSQAYPSQAYPPQAYPPQAYPPQAHPPQAQAYQTPTQYQPYYAQPVVIQSPVQSPNQPVLQGPVEAPIATTQPSHGLAGQVTAPAITNRTLPPEIPAPQQATSPPIQPTGVRVDSGPGHLANGMNLFGTELRHSGKTATESAIELQNQNKLLHEQLKTMTLKAEKLAKEYQAQETTLADSKERLNESNRLAASLREKIATLNVKVRDLEREKVMVEINADKALKEIESQLDAMLLNSLSQLKK